MNVDDAKSYFRIRWRLLFDNKSPLVLRTGIDLPTEHDNKHHSIYEFAKTIDEIDDITISCGKYLLANGHSAQYLLNKSDDIFSGEIDNNLIRIVDVDKWNTHHLKRNFSVFFLLSATNESVWKNFRPSPSFGIFRLTQKRLAIFCIENNIFDIDTLTSFGGAVQIIVESRDYFSAIRGAARNFLMSKDIINVCDERFGLSLSDFLDYAIILEETDTGSNIFKIRWRRALNFEVVNRIQNNSDNVKNTEYNVARRTKALSRIEPGFSECVRAYAAALDAQRHFDESGMMRSLSSGYEALVARIVDKYLLPTLNTKTNKKKRNQIKKKYFSSIIVMFSSMKYQIDYQVASDDKLYQIERALKKNIGSTDDRVNEKLNGTQLKFAKFILRQQYGSCSSRVSLEWLFNRFSKEFDFAIKCRNFLLHENKLLSDEYTTILFGYCYKTILGYAIASFEGKSLDESVDLNTFDKVVLATIYQFNYYSDRLDHSIFKNIEKSSWMLPGNLLDPQFIEKTNVLLNEEIMDMILAAINKLGDKFFLFGVFAHK